jgi:hypothetical protein
MTLNETATKYRAEILLPAVVSLSLAVAVGMIPAGGRLHIGGSGGNTVPGFIIDYNGLHRLETGGMGDANTRYDCAGYSGQTRV